MAALGKETGSLRWLAAGCFVSVLLATPALISSLFDDAFIHARIASNLIQTGEFAYALGDRFKASSSTGYVLALALAMQAVPAEAALRLIPALATIACVAGLSQLIHASRGRRLTAFICSAAILPYLLVASYGGMETPIACALMVWAAVCFQKGRTDAALLLIAIATWFRFEMFFLLGVAMAQACLNSRSLHPVRNAAPAALLVIFEWVRFGSIVPHAALAKPLVYAVPGDISILSTLVLGNGVAGFFCSTSIILSVCAQLAARFAARDSLAPQLPFLLLSLALLGAWAAGGTLIFEWYFCLLACSFGLACLLAPAVSGQRSAVSGQAKHGQVKPSGIVGLLAMLGLGLTGGHLLLDQFRVDVVRAPPNLRTERYLQIGEGLRSECPSCSLLTSEIGGLGFGFRGRIHDAIGLVDPQAIQFHPLPVPQARKHWFTGAIPPLYVRKHKPDYVVSMPGFSTSLRQSTELAAYFRYECPIGRRGANPLRIYGDTTIEIYSRSSLSTEALSAMACRAAGRQR